MSARYVLDEATWADADEPLLLTATQVAAELADPIRLTVLRLLTRDGAHGTSQLAELLGISLARLGYHLGKLVDAGLVSAERTGRHVSYRLHDDKVVPLLDALADYAGGDLPTPSAAPPSARLCYDHVAGVLGSALLSHLLTRDALARVPDSDELVLGANAGPTLAPWGIDAAGLDPGRRKLATGCLDRLLRRHHLGGALGNVMVRQLQQRELVTIDVEAHTAHVNSRCVEQLQRLLPEMTIPEIEAVGA